MGILADLLDLPFRNINGNVIGLVLDHDFSFLRQLVKGNTLSLEGGERAIL